MEVTAWLVLLALVLIHVEARRASAMLVENEHRLRQWQALSDEVEAAAAENLAVRRGLLEAIGLWNLGCRDDARQVLLDLRDKIESE